MEKSPEAFRTISEVAEFLETPAHVLRFWESRFPQIRPVKRAGGRRYYRPSDVALLSGIKRLLHEDGLTIRGVQKILQEQGVKHVAGLMDEEAEASLAAEVETAPTPAAEPIPLFPDQMPAPPARTVQPELFDSPQDHDAPVDPAENGRIPDIDGAVAGDTESSAGTGEDPKSADPEQEQVIPTDALTDALTTGTPNETGAADALSDPAEVPDQAQEVALAEVSDSTPPPFEAEPVTDAVGLLSSSDSQGPDSPQSAELEPPLPKTEVVQPLASTSNLPGSERFERPARWLAAELRGLPATALYGKADRAAALAQRLRSLRGRLAPTGRGPLR